MNGETEPLAEEHTVDRTQSILSSSVALLFTGSSSIDEDQRCCAALCCAVLRCALVRGRSTTPKGTCHGKFRPRESVSQSVDGKGVWRIIWTDRKKEASPGRLRSS